MLPLLLNMIVILNSLHPGFGQQLNLIDILSGPVQAQPTSSSTGSTGSDQPQFNQAVIPNTIGQPSMTLGTSGGSGPQIVQGNMGILGSSGPQIVQGFCTEQEKSTLFNSCAMSFGMKHMSHFGYLSSQPQCHAEVFSCREVDNLVKCVNSQPVSIISNNCWANIQEALSGFLHKYGIPCSYQNLNDRCKGTTTEIMLAEQRPRQGTGMNTNPMAGIMNIVMPMVMLGMGGGFSSMFGF